MINPAVSWNRQAFLAFLLFGLGSFTYWLEFNHRPAQEELDENTKHLFQLKDLTIEQVQLAAPGSPTVVLSCLDREAMLCHTQDRSKWEMQAPLQARADSGVVNSMLSGLASANPNETLDLKEESAEKKLKMLKEYGLDLEGLKKALRITVLTPQGRTTLYLGNKHPIGDTSFGWVENAQAKDPKATPAQAPEGVSDAASNQQQVQVRLEDITKVVLVPSFIRAHAEKSLSYWRDKKLLTLQMPEIEKVSFHSNPSTEATHSKKKSKQPTAAAADSHFTLAKNKTGASTTSSSDSVAGRWELELKPQLWVSSESESVSSVLSALLSATAKDLLANHKTDPEVQTLLKQSPLVASLAIGHQKKASAGESGDHKTESHSISVQVYRSTPHSPLLAQLRKKMLGPATESNSDDAPASRDEADDKGTLLVTVSSEDPLFEIDGATFEKLSKKISDLQLKKPLSPQDKTLAKQLTLQWSHPDHPEMALTWKNEVWESTLAVNPASVKKMLEELAGEKIQSFLQPGSAEHRLAEQAFNQEPVLRFTVKNEAGELRRDWKFCKKQDELYGQDQHSPLHELWRLDKTLVSALPWEPTSLQAAAATPSASPQQ